MPNDLFKWESAGGTVHHCPQCFKPLTTPKAKRRCLGTHVEPCKRYHAVFKKGTSCRCDPCIREDEEHLKRHREIAGLLLELKRAKASDESPNRGSPLTLSALKSPLDSPTAPHEQSPPTKKDRKAAKKATKKPLSTLATVVTSADINFVANVLSPEPDDIDVELQLLSDPDVALNRAFHAGTSNRREIRNEFVVKDKRLTKKGTHDIGAEEVAGLRQLLNVSPLTTTASAEEKKTREKLNAKVREHLGHVRNEEEMLDMRKAGFWRWASRKVYKRLVESGRVRSLKSASSSSADMSAEKSASSSFDADDEEEDDGDDDTEVDTDITTPDEEQDGAAEVTLTGLAVDDNANQPASGPVVSKADTTTTPLSPTHSNTDTDDGWTTVANAKTNAKSTNGHTTTIGKVTLSANGGLTKMASAVTPSPRRRGFAVSYEHLY